MTKKVTLKDKKGFKFKFEKEVTIDGYNFKKEKEYEFSLNDKENEEIDLKHDGAIPEGKVTGKIKAAKDGNTAEKEIDGVEFHGKFDKGYFWDSFEINEAKKGNENIKFEKAVSVRTGADVLGLNYWGWGGVALILIGMGTLGYYWWTSYSKEEEEENI